MNGVYCDNAIKKEFEAFFGQLKLDTGSNIYVLYDEKPEVIGENAVIIVNGDNKRLLKSLAGTDGTVITCGMSGVSTFTFSSMNDESCVLCLQRAVVSFGGKLLQPQELPVSLGGNTSDPDRLILLLAFAFLAQQNITETQISSVS